MISFDVVTAQAPEGVTTSTSFDLPSNIAGDSTTLGYFDPLTHYFRAAKDAIGSAMADLIQNPPSVSSVVYYALKNPGIDVQDRAVELLGFLTPYTLQFARNYHDHEFLARPIYANKTWEIVISALGLADTVYAPHCKVWITQQLVSPNPVKRLAAHDALEALSPSVPSAP